MSVKWGIFILTLLVNIQLNAGLSVEEELTLTHQEKQTLDTFRGRVEKALTQEYMKHDLYLIRWLRDAKLNVDLAEKNILDTMRWRRENNVDEINTLDWSDFVDDYPYTTNVYDREGRPTFVFSFSAWDVRQAALSGQTQRMILYWAKVFEELAAKVRQLQAEGQNVTQSNLVADVRDYNVIQHSCPQCIPIYTGLITLLQKRYPGEIHRANLVNAPRLFEVLMQILRPAIGDTGNTFKIYGPNKKVWQSALLEEFSESELPPEFGGTNRNAFKKINDV